MNLSGNELTADHLLEHGIQGASLRPLAAAVGTSDRMLLHYFVNKEELMTAALNLIAARMITLLESARPTQIPFHDLLPYLRLWLELAALSAREEAYQRIARQIGDRFYEWLAEALQVETEEERAPMTALAYAIIEGFVFLDAIGGRSIITSALDGLQPGQ